MRKKIVNDYYSVYYTRTRIRYIRLLLCVCVCVCVFTRISGTSKFSDTKITGKDIFSFFIALVKTRAFLILLSYTHSNIHFRNGLKCRLLQR